MTEPNAPYLHLEVARARRSVLEAQRYLAACELAECTSRIQLTRLKVRHFKKATQVANADVGLWCDTIRHSGRPLYSWDVTTEVSKRRRRRYRTAFSISTKTYLLTTSKIRIDVAMRVTRNILSICSRTCDMYISPPIVRTSVKFFVKWMYRLLCRVMRTTYHTITPQRLDF